MMGTTSFITMQSLGKVAQCAPAVGAKMWCLFFFVCWSSSEYGARAFEGCIVRTSIALSFIVRFRRYFQRFFQNELLVQMHYIVLIFVARWRYNFREITVKIAKSPKIGGKVCAHHFV